MGSESNRSPSREAANDWVGMIVKLVINHISAATNFILQDINGPDKAKEVSYVFGITFEKQERTEQSEHVKKVRVLLIREEALNELENLDIDEVKLQSYSDHHKMRFDHLKLLAKYWKWTKWSVPSQIRPRHCYCFCWRNSSCLLRLCPSLYVRVIAGTYKGLKKRASGSPSFSSPSPSELERTSTMSPQAALQRMQEPSSKVPYCGSLKLCVPDTP